MASSASTSQNVTSSQIRYSESLNFPDADIEILSRLGETPEKSQYGFRLHKNVLVANLRAFADMIDLGSESEGSTASVTLPEEGPDLERLFSFVNRKESYNFQSLVRLSGLAAKYGVESLNAALLPLLLTQVRHDSLILASPEESRKMRAIDKGPGLCDFINMVLLLNHAALTNNDTLQEACLLFTSLQLGFHNESGLLAQDPYEEETRQLCPSAALVFWKYHYAELAKSVQA